MGTRTKPEQSVECPCVRGGDCTREGADVLHAVRVTWVKKNGREPDTVANPRQLDEWMASGTILGARCSQPGCEDEVEFCPKFSPYLLDKKWLFPMDD